MGTLLVHCYELRNVKIFILYSTDRKIDVENWRGVGGMLLGNQGITYLQPISKGFHYIFYKKKWIPLRDCRMRHIWEGY